MASEWAQEQYEQIDRTSQALCFACGERRYHMARVRCACGKNMLLKDAYKCYYCDEYLCVVCAADHFGKTKEQYANEKIKATQAGEGESK
ncbi:MAG: hypothetical protein LBS36_13565 [Oscillospiraceae bacterium]|jgi:hypothetical protein|nr:hypothetical protein [Oscillospiraceae bacterium]